MRNLRGYSVHLVSCEQLISIQRVYILWHLLIAQRLNGIEADLELPCEEIDYLSGVRILNSLLIAGLTVH